MDFLKRSDGVSAVEFGIVLPVLMTLLIGIMEYGFVFYVDLNLTNAAREGAREGVTQTVAEHAQQLAAQTARDYLENAGLEATVDCTMPSQGVPVVQVTATIDPFKPLIGFLPESAMPSRLSAVSAMRWEMAPAP